MNIVVTGCCGFIGSCFSILARERNHTVIGLDNESRGLNDFRGQLYTKYDCLGGIGEGLIPHRIEKVDAVVHLAAATGSLERPLDELMLWNVEMMKRVYHDARRLGASAFIWPTTSLALGVPDSPYVISKEKGLEALLDLDKREQISLPVRFFNVMGAYRGCTELRRNEVHILPEMFRAWKNNTAFTINGNDWETPDGSPSRDFVHVLDVCEYLLELVQKKVEGRQIKNHSDGAVWLGTGQLTTVKQVVKIFEQWAGPVRTELGPRRAFDCGHLDVDNRQCLNFEASRGLLTPSWVAIRDEIEALKLVWDGLQEDY